MDRIVLGTVVDHVDDDGPRRKMHHHHNNNTNSSRSSNNAPAAAAAVAFPLLQRSSLRVAAPLPSYHHLIRPSDERYQKIKKIKKNKRSSMISSKLFLLILAIGVIGLTTFSSLAILLEAQQQQSSSSQLRALSSRTSTTKGNGALETHPQQHEDDDDTATAAAARKPQRLLLPRADQRGSWIGDVWVPPVGYTLYTAPDLVQLWGISTNGILWIGDSTARRSSLTLWEILHHGATAGADGGTGNNATTTTTTSATNNNTTNNKDSGEKITTTTASSSSSSAQTTTIDIAKNLLEANDHINVNHKGHALEKCHAWPRIKGADICRQLSLPVSATSSSSSSSSSAAAAATAATPVVTTTRPFVFKRLNCYQEVTQFLQHEMSQPDSVLHQVDTIVLALGLWDITMAHQCGIAPPTTTANTTKDSAAKSTTIMVNDDSNNNNSSRLSNTTTTTRDRQQQLLETLYQLPGRFTILWRTTSYANPEDAPAIDQYNQYAMDEMDNWWRIKEEEEDMDKASDRDQPPPPPPVRRPVVHYVDFARVIFPRSFGKDRIQGDHYAHYGSTARVVMIQMLSNLLDALYQTKKKQQQTATTTGAGTTSATGELEIASAAGRSVDPQ
jgi:hypothetical protein